MISKTALKQKVKDIASGVEAVRKWLDRVTEEQSEMSDALYWDEAGTDAAQLASKIYGYVKMARDCIFEADEVQRELSDHIDGLLNDIMVILEIEE